MIFSADTDIYRIRANLEKYLPSGASGWTFYHESAGRRILEDLVPLISDFDSNNLNAGWHFWSTETIAVSASEMVYVTDTHNAGGVAEHVYKALSDIPETDLATVDFTGADWEDVTDTLSKAMINLSCYRALCEIYRFLVVDQPDEGFRQQRDYFDKLYMEELSRLFDGNLIPYDFGDSIDRSYIQAVAVW